MSEGGGGGSWELGTTAGSRHPDRRVCTFIHPAGAARLDRRILSSGPLMVPARRPGWSVGCSRRELRRLTTAYLVTIALRWLPPLKPYRHLAAC